ncbi:MAG: crosslink repair DNA glycosylase YcaQ family protein [Polyangiaceae bacterium]
MAVISLDTTQARRLLIASAALADDRARRATLGEVHELVRRLGYVQVDSINVVERAHHLTLFSRLSGYRKSQLTFLLEKRRALFEHWTHDASILPIEWFPFYRRRFERDRARIRKQPWWLDRMTGGKRRDLDALFADVLARFEREGPLGTGDFKPGALCSGVDEAEARKSERAGFWSWTPEKAALEYLWRTGALAVSHRTNFQKVYDLTPRVLSGVHAAETPTEAAQHDWAFGEALARMGIGTPREIAAFFHDSDRHAASAWARRAIDASSAVEADVRTHEGTRRMIVAPDYESRIARASGASGALRLLSPFDPLLRDRARVKLLFGLDFRFEGFVPKADRVHGYYVMAALEGDDIVAKIDPKLDRARGVLVIQNVWWTRGFGGSSARERALVGAVEELARWLGATSIELRRR